MAEYGIVAAKGISRLRDLLPVLDADAGVLPERARQTLLLIAQLIEALTTQVRRIETELLAWHRSNPTSKRLETIPGVGVITRSPAINSRHRKESGYDVGDCPDRAERLAGC